MAFTDDYVLINERIAAFRASYPEGALQPWDPAHPYRIEQIPDAAGKPVTYIVVVAAAYRTPTDMRPGVGMAYEIFPGTTNFTRRSELQNAETSAWGRAIVAALAADTSRAIASAEDVRNRKAEEEEVPVRPAKNRTMVQAFAARDARVQSTDDPWATPKPLDPIRRDAAVQTIIGISDRRELAKIGQFAMDQGMTVWPLTADQVGMMSMQPDATIGDLLDLVASSLPAVGVDDDDRT